MSTSKEKITACKDCKWIQDDGYCTSPNIVINEDADLTTVNFYTGEIEKKKGTDILPGLVPIAALRQRDIDEAGRELCGTEARWFEQKGQGENMKSAGSAS